MPFRTVVRGGRCRVEGTGMMLLERRVAEQLHHAVMKVLVDST